ncbi:MAG: hypothetical protein QXF61_01120 [Nitrososphaeria archaeon]
MHVAEAKDPNIIPRELLKLFHAKNRICSLISKYKNNIIRICILISKYQMMISSYQIAKYSII